MSNSKKAVQEIKKLMVQFGFLADEPTLLSFKLEDNTILQTAKLEAGNEIVKINEEFEQVKLEDGSYRLVENFEIEVKDGKIEVVKEVFLDAKLADGTVVKVEGDSLAEGAKVLVVTADAEIPAPDGVHELVDGTKIETKDGIIAKIEEVVGDVEEGEAPEAPAVEVGMDAQMFEMLKEFISKMGEKMSAMEQSYSALENEFNSFKKEPAAKKVADGKTEKFTKLNNNDELDAKIAAIMSLQKLNK
jgi:hypothetical protein